jgi:hypothetical protein
MSKHEIRLRRQRLTARGTERFRNYGAVLERYEREMRIKKIMRAFTLFMIILIAIMLLIIVFRVERRVTRTKSSTATSELFNRLAIKDPLT